MKIKGLALFLVAALGVLLPASGQERAQQMLDIQNKKVMDRFMAEHSENLAKTPEDVISRHIKAIGGEEQLRKIKTMRITYTPLDSIDRKVFIVRYYKFPHFVRQDNLSSGRATSTNGEKVWLINDEGWKELKGSPWSYTPDIYGDFIDYQKRDISYKLQGVEAIDRVVYYHLVKSHDDGEKRDYYFSAETGLHRMERRDFGMGKDIKSYWDFRRVEGILFPFLFIVTLDSGFGQVHGAIIKEIEINLPLDDSLFQISN